MYNTKLGQIGENIATEYLRKNDFLIVDRNFYAKGGEIDIVAFDPHSSELVFVEVKCRTSEDWAYLDETLSWTKIQRIRKVIESYLELYCYGGFDWRIDHIAIKLTKKHQIQELKYFPFVNAEF